MKKLKYQDKIDENTCDLSIYSERSREAKVRFNEIKSNTPNFGKKVGNYISTGKLEIEDGVSDDANRVGHFTHFEYENIDLANKFVVITKI